MPDDQSGVNHILFHADAAMLPYQSSNFFHFGSSKVGSSKVGMSSAGAWLTIWTATRGPRGRVNLRRVRSRRCH